MRRRKRFWIGVGLLALLLASGAAGLASFRNSPALAVFLGEVMPLDLGQAGPWWLDWRLRALRGNRDLCRKVLVRPHVEVVEIADSEPVDGCGWASSVRLAEAGGVRLPVDRITCELAAALALWLEHEVQQLARDRFGERVTAIEHRGSYSCRNIRGSANSARWRSQHASANALDISAFVLASGRKVVVAKHWSGETDDGRFLHAVHLAACRYFRVALSPNFNAAHRDHFHYDRGPWIACR